MTHPIPTDEAGLSAEAPPMTDSKSKAPRVRWGLTGIMGSPRAFAFNAFVGWRVFGQVFEAGGGLGGSKPHDRTCWRWITVYAGVLGTIESGIEDTLDLAKSACEAAILTWLTSLGEYERGIREGLREAAAWHRERELHHEVQMNKQAVGTNARVHESASCMTHRESAKHLLALANAEPLPALPKGDEKC